MEDVEPPAEGVGEAGENVAVTPGMLEADRVTGELKPLTDVMVVVVLPDEPTFTASSLTEEVSVKEGVWITRLTVQL